MANENLFPDPLDYELEARLLAKRRALAEKLANQPGGVIKGEMIGRNQFYVPPGFGAYANQVLERTQGRADMDKVDAQQRLLSANENNIRTNLVRELGKTGTESVEQTGPTQPGESLPNIEQPLSPEKEKARRHALYAEGMKLPSLRGTIEKQFQDELAQPLKMEGIDAKLAGAQALNDARNAAQMAGIEARIQGQKDLRQMPTTHISIQGGGGGGNRPDAPPAFAGAATQVGIDPRTEQPIFRVTKTGALFQYGPNGEYVPHQGAIAPKPAASGAPTEAERSSAGYLGRMEAVEGALANAKPLPLAQQVGMARAPTATNYTLSPEQQVQRQQQEDWVRAKLRKESGAVIGKDEMASEISMYFPQAGDSPQVVAQKAQSRAQAREQVRSSAGRAKPTQAPAVGGAPVPVANRAAWQALPPGTRFVMPDGKTGVK